MSYKLRQNLLFRSMPTQTKGKRDIMESGIEKSITVDGLGGFQQDKMLPTPGWMKEHLKAQKNCNGRYFSLTTDSV